MLPRKWTLRSPSMLAGAALALALTPAYANVAAPIDYAPKADGNTVVICGSFVNTCYDDPKSPLVRKDVATGRMVIVPHHCDEHHCFVDECVPPGTYQWGQADPAECVGTSSLTYEGEGTVTAPLAADCAPKLGTERPTPFTGKLPWTASNIACRGGYCQACAVGSPSGEVAVLCAGGAALVVALGLFARRRLRARARRG